MMRRALPPATMAQPAAWATQRERGSLPAIRLMVWLALHLGRNLARLLLGPICLYFMMFSPRASVASREYLGRVLGRPARWTDGFRHVHSFAACLLDRIYLLHDRAELFDFTISGEDVLRPHLAAGTGCLLFGAHFGSFDAIRAAGRVVKPKDCHVRMALVMYEENARKANAVLHAINPDLALEIIALGKPGAMLAAKNRLDAGDLVGVLADRALTGDRMVMLPFLGAPAPFPAGPFRMAVLLRKPVVLMLGIYRGGRRYDICFEEIGLPETFTETATEAAMLAMMQRYAARLEAHCLAAPYNWSNFFPFWAAP